MTVPAYKLCIVFVRVNSSSFIQNIDNILQKHMSLEVSVGVPRLLLLAQQETEQCRLCTFPRFL